MTEDDLLGTAGDLFAPEILSREDAILRTYTQHLASLLTVTGGRPAPVFCFALGTAVCVDPRPLPDGGTKIDILATVATAPGIMSPEVLRSVALVLEKRVIPQLIARAKTLEEDMLGG